MGWNCGGGSIGISPQCVLTGAVFIFCGVVGVQEWCASVMFVEVTCGRGSHQV